MIEDVVRPAGPYRLHLMTYGRPFETPLPGGGQGRAWQRTADEFSKSSDAAQLRSKMRSLTIARTHPRPSLPLGAR